VFSGVKLVAAGLIYSRAENQGSVAPIESLQQPTFEDEHRSERMFFVYLGDTSI
jgi:hypothetical protein